MTPKIPMGRIIRIRRVVVMRYSIFIAHDGERLYEVRGYINLKNLTHTQSQMKKGHDYEQ